MTEETWLPIPTWPHYEVSNLGRVRSERRSGAEGKLLNQFVANHGYPCVNLSAPGRRAQRPVHRLVLLAFAGEPPDGFEACHNDGDKLNCRASNLRWDTPLANAADKRSHGTMNVGDRNGARTKHLIQPGMTFGTLTVLHRAKNNSSQNMRFMCRCSCGKACSYRGTDLRNGKRTKCHVCDRVERRQRERSATPSVSA